MTDFEIEEMMILERELLTNKHDNKDIKECISKNICVECKKDAKEFRHFGVLEEYLNSGLCEKCQDEEHIWL